MHMPIDFEERVMEKIDRTDDKVSDICERLTRMETLLEEHFKGIAANDSRKERKFYYAIAVLGIGIAFYEVLGVIL